MSESVKRTVRLGSMSYVDPGGQVRWADRGTEIDVHPGHVERFDRLNVLLGEGVVESEAPASVASTDDSVAQQEVSEPKRRPGRPRKSED